MVLKGKHSPIKKFFKMVDFKQEDIRNIKRDLQQSKIDKKKLAKE